MEAWQGGGRSGSSLAICLRKRRTASDMRMTWRLRCLPDTRSARRSAVPHIRISISHFHIFRIFIFPPIFSPTFLYGRQISFSLRLAVIQSQLVRADTVVWTFCLFILHVLR